MRVKKLYQQGDVLVELVEKTEGLELKKKAKNLVLAEGEVTGHKHLLTLEEDEINYDVLEGQIVFTISKDATITHEEHHAIVLPPTRENEIYRVRRVREYDHFAEEAREVRD